MFLVSFFILKVLCLCNWYQNSGRDRKPHRLWIRANNKKPEQCDWLLIQLFCKLSTLKYQRLPPLPAMSVTKISFLATNYFSVFRSFGFTAATSTNELRFILKGFCMITVWRGIIESSSTAGGCVERKPFNWWKWWEQSWIWKNSIIFWCYLVVLYHSTYWNVILCTSLWKALRWVQAVQYPVRILI